MESIAVIVSNTHTHTHTTINPPCMQVLMNLGDGGGCRRSNTCSFPGGLSGMGRRGRSRQGPRLQGAGMVTISMTCTYNHNMCNACTGTHSHTHEKGTRQTHASQNTCTTLFHGGESSLIPRASLSPPRFFNMTLDPCN